MNRFACLAAAAEFRTIDSRHTFPAFEVNHLGFPLQRGRFNESFVCGAQPMNRQPMCGGEFVARINRSEWGMKYALPAVADELLLLINVKAVKD